jgi:hypothetical protein
MIEIFFACLISSITFIAFGYVFNFIFHRKKISNIDLHENTLFGLILLSFFSLIVNFFIPLNKVLGSFIIITSIIFYLYTTIVLKHKNLFYLLSISIISFFLITLSNINRPDAGLYHLPYIGLINSEKIIIGSTNINFRFGHISIIQYLSGIFNNYFFKIEIITLPLAFIFSIYIIFITKKYIKISNSNNKFLKIYIFFLIIYSLYGFSNYTNYGNDMPAHIYFFILSIYLIEEKNLFLIKKEIFFKILLISIFLFSIKPFMILTLLIPLTVFILNKSKLKIIQNNNTILILIFIFALLIKNILSSGCLIYPVSATCFKSFLHFDLEKTVQEYKVAEAWSKGWPDSVGYSSYELYSSNFNWLSTWINNHLIKIFFKLLPYFIFLILIILIFFYFTQKKFEKKSINTYKRTNVKIFFFFTLFFTIVWFVKFPVYRFGESFIIVLIAIIAAYISHNILTSKFSDKLLKKFFLYILVFAFSIFFLKNYIRIHKLYDIFYINYPWPRIYTLNNKEENKLKDYKNVRNNNNELLYFYSQGDECMYINNPCSNYLQNNLFLKKVFNYKIFYKN